MKGGADIDGHESIEHMEQMMEGLEQGGEMSSPQQMNGGGKKSSKKTTSKKSSKKGGNFLGTVGVLVAPSGWETFATTAGLFALDRADAALRRGKKDKKQSSKKMKGGDLTCKNPDEPIFVTSNVSGTPRGYKYEVCCDYNGEHICRSVTYDKRPKISKGIDIDKNEEQKRFNQAKNLIETYIRKTHNN
jgi:hypothetical protein